MDLSSSLEQTFSLQGTLNALLQTVPIIEVRTAFTPPFRLDTRADPGETAKPSPLAKFTKPTVVGIGADGTELFTIAPEGEAGASDWIPYGVGVGLGVALILALTFYAGRASR